MADATRGFNTMVRIGRQADRTTPCAFSPGDFESSGNAGRWFNLPISPEGLQGGGVSPSVDVPTQHGSRGVLASIEADRNGEAGSIAMPLWPHALDFIMSLPKLVSDQLEYYTIEKYHTDVAGDGIGSRFVGCFFGEMNIPANRETTSALTVTLPFFLNQLAPVYRIINSALGISLSQ